jgi:RNA polymerase sigma factor (sigma-70 family)
MEGFFAAHSDDAPPEVSAWFERAARVHGDLGLDAGEFRRRLAEIGSELEAEGAAQGPGPAALRSLCHDDLYLAHALCLGSEAAWARFERIYRPLIWHAAQRWSRSPSEAEDLALQFCGDLYCATLRSGRRRGLWGYRGLSTLTTWLYTVLYRVALNHRRARAIEAAHDSRRRTGAAGAGRVAPPPDQVLAEEQIAERVRRVLPEVLGLLEPEERNLLRNYYVLELTFREIGLLVGQAPGHVCRRLHAAEARALAELRRRLRTWNVEPEDAPLELLARETPSPLATLLGGPHRDEDETPEEEPPPGEELPPEGTPPREAAS